MTVIELKKLCEEQIAKGNGDKVIYISADEEGNFFNELFYAFTEINENQQKEMLEDLKKFTNGNLENMSIKDFMEDLYCGISYENMEKSIILG